MWLRRLCGSKLKLSVGVLQHDDRFQFWTDEFVLAGAQGFSSRKTEKVSEVRSPRSAVLLLQLFNLQIDNQALERRTQARARMLQEKQEKLAALERSLIAAQEEVRGGA
jgi:hypothetical protein